MVRIRPASVEDAEALGQFTVESWRAAYAGLVPEDVLATMDPGDRGRRWREILGGAGRLQTLVAVAEDQVVGFVSVGPPLAAAEPGTAWLYALYVDADRWGTGLGHRLHEDGLELMRAADFSRAELWVLRSNSRAIVFYERHGWRVDGRSQIDRHLAGVELDEIGLSRPL